MKVALILYDVDLKEFDLSNYFKIGVDKGCINAINNNLVLDYAVGDFDSITCEELKVVKENSKEIKILNPIKDETDTFEAINKALTISNDITIFGGISGNRIEHFLSNLTLFKLNSNLKIIDNNSYVFLKDKDFTINKNEYEKYKYISFFSLSNDLLITLSGFKYNLNNYNLKINDPLCVSNEIIESPIVKINKKVLIILTKKD